MSDWLDEGINEKMGLRMDRELNSSLGYSKVALSWSFKRPKRFLLETTSSELLPRCMSSLDPHQVSMQPTRYMFVSIPPLKHRKWGWLRPSNTHIFPAYSSHFGRRSFVDANASLPSWCKGNRYVFFTLPSTTVTYTQAQRLSRKSGTSLNLLSPVN